MSAMVMQSVSGGAFGELLGQMMQTARHAAIITLQKVRFSTGELRSRINIENQRQLKASGFAAGTRFEVSYRAGVVEIIATEHGTNVIAPKRFAKRDGTQEVGERLDLRSQQIYENFAGQERVLALYMDNRVVFMHLPTVTRKLGRIEQLIGAIERKALKTAAFYAGIGTLDAAMHEGFKKAGIHSELALVNEMVPEANDALLNDNPAASRNTKSFCGGIEQFVASGQCTTKVDFFAAGVPCKGASKLNVATRDLPEMHPFAGHQVMNTILAIQRLDYPPLLLIENVTAYADTVSLSMLRRVLEEQGYTTVLVGDRGEDNAYLGINSNDYGDIERRVRMALLAYPDGIDLQISMVKTGPSTRTVGDIRLPEWMIDQAEYEKGIHLNSEEKRAKGWRNRIVKDSDVITPTMSADAWKQRVEDPKLMHPTIAGKCRLPVPEEHAALKGHDARLIRSLVANSHAHTALGNGTAKRCWVEFSRALGVALQDSCESMRTYVAQFRKSLELMACKDEQNELVTEPQLF